MDAPILIVEDDPQIAELMELYLSREGWPVVAVASAEAAQAVMAERLPALMLLDLNLPGMDGFQFLRGLGNAVPVIIVSSRESDEDKIGGLGLGADDFVTKPFSPKVLVARVAALLRRTRALPPNRLAFGPFVLDFEASSLTKGGRPVALRRREWDLLAFLASHPGIPFSPEEIYRRVWGLEFGDLTTVAVHVQRLRRRLEEPPGAPRYLKTQPGFGYCFEPGGPS